jgi:hypothetical protein
MQYFFVLDKLMEEKNVANVLQCDLRIPDIGYSFKFIL